VESSFSMGPWIALGGPERPASAIRVPHLGDRQVSVERDLRSVRQGSAMTPERISGDALVEAR
jgi:hypothetical protein